MALRLRIIFPGSLDEYPTWHISGLMNFIQKGDALLSIYANDPDVYNGIDPERVGALQKAHVHNYHEISLHVSRNAINWCVVASAAPAWAKKIFPDLPEAEAQEKLWRAIFETTRATEPDPVSAWQEHIRNLKKRADFLQTKRFSALHYKSENTDFTLGLPRGHKWINAQSMAENGIIFTANMPTEEIFTLPDRQRADGTVASTFPLSYGGSLIGFSSPTHYQSISSYIFLSPKTQPHPYLSKTATADVSSP